MDNIPEVSICLTTYNRANTLDKTINSILSQTYTAFELIISDDNSTDNTEEICRRYLKSDPRVKYYKNSINLKMPGNLNKCISRAKCIYIANLHDGDIYRNDLIEKWINVLKKYPEALFVFNQYKMLDANGNLKFIIDHKLEEINDGKLLFDYYINTLSSAPWGTVMVRREAYEKYGIFNEEFGFISDVEMWLRLGANGKFCYVKEPLIELTPREIIHKYYLPHWEFFYLVIKILYTCLPLYYKNINSELINSIKKKISKKLIYESVILLKHLSLSRFREYLYLNLRSTIIINILFAITFFFILPRKPLNFNKEEWGRIIRIKYQQKDYNKI